MGLFDDTTSGKKEEVRIGVPDEEDNSSKLRSEVESKIDTTSSSGRSSGSSNDTSLDDIRRQNEKIISLLQKLVDDEGIDNSSSRVTDRNTGRNNDDGMRGGMDELL